MGRYAQGTRVTPEQTRVDIEVLIKRNGGDRFGYADGDNGAQITFRYDGKFVRFRVLRPSEGDYWFDQAGRRRKIADIRASVEAEFWRRWRVLLLRLRALFEEIATDPSRVTELLLPYYLLPSMETVAEWAKPQLEAIYERGAMPLALPMGTHP